MERTPEKDTRAAAPPGDGSPPRIEVIASMRGDDVLDLLGTRATGLTDAEADVRLRSFGPNAVRTHHANAVAVLARQLRSALLLLLLAAAVVSAFVGQGTDAIIIGVIIAASVGLGLRTVNLTDEESRIMPVAGGGFEQCYNAQAVVAAGSLLVIAADVVQAPNDK